MEYAVISSGGKQYKVSVGQEILVDKLSLEKGKNFVFPYVLLVRNDENILIGNPYVAQAKVAGKVVDEIKGDKITVSKFKAKVRYRRKIGFRPLYTKVRIESILPNGKKTLSPQKAKRQRKSAVK